LLIKRNARCIAGGRIKNIHPIPALHMNDRQDWHTESYKGMEVHVTALVHEGSQSEWDFTVRITQPGDDAGSASELTAQSGDDADYPSREAAVEAGFIKGYTMVDELLG
jgi:hypothetical protein